MERAKLLRTLMENKNMKVADIVRISGVPYSTVKYILENGIEKASYTNVQKICKALGITTDDLETMLTGNDEPHTVAAHLDTVDLTETELTDVANYIEFLKAKRNK